MGRTETGKLPIHWSSAEGGWSGAQHEVLQWDQHLDKTFVGKALQRNSLTSPT